MLITFWNKGTYGPIMTFGAPEMMIPISAPSPTLFAGNPPMNTFDDPNNVVAAWGIQLSPAKIVCGAMILPETAAGENAINVLN
jgi:hypothetical protein